MNDIRNTARRLLEALTDAIGEERGVTYDMPSRYVARLRETTDNAVRGLRAALDAPDPVASSPVRGWIESLQQDVQAARRHRESRGGQQAGVPRFALFPPSALIYLDRWCRDALEACDAPDPVAAADDLIRYSTAVDLMVAHASRMVAAETTRCEAACMAVRAKHHTRWDPKVTGAIEESEIAAAMAAARECANAIRARTTPAPSCDYCGGTRALPIVEPDGSVDRDRRAPPRRPPARSDAVDTFNEYQAECRRTAPRVQGGPVTDPAILKEELSLCGMGVAGEAGEACDLCKKIVHHGLVLDDVVQAKLLKEVGDVLWYVAHLCSVLGVQMGDVAQANIDKLRARYPQGWDTTRANDPARDATPAPAPDGEVPTRLVPTALAGERVDAFAGRLRHYAFEYGAEVEGEFNGTPMWAKPDDSVNEIVERWSIERQVIQAARGGK